MNACVTNIQRFSIHDGPGIRTTVFFKGCNMACRWCHNPETRSPFIELQFNENLCIDCKNCADVCKNSDKIVSRRDTKNCILCGECAKNCYSGALSLSGREMTKEEIIKEILKDQSLFKRSGGGVTFSGGEPMLQIEFLEEILPVLKNKGIHIAIETASNVPFESFERIIPFTQLFMCDIKCFDDVRHKEYTGASNQQILANIRNLASKNVDLLLRTPVVPGFNDNEKEIAAIGKYVLSLPKKVKIELLPFHNIGQDKYESLGIEYEFKNVASPTKEKMQTLCDVLLALGVDASLK